MATKRDDPADRQDGAESELVSFFADEETLDRQAMWRLGSWGIGSVAAVTIAIFASQSIGQTRRAQSAEDLAQQSLDVQRIARESRDEARRLASAVETLTGDRDRLYRRVTSLELALDSVTGSIARQTAAQPVPPDQLPAAPEPLQIAALSSPAVAPVETVAAVTPVLAGAIDPALASAHAAVAPTTPLLPPQSIMAPPDPAARLLEPVSVHEPDSAARPDTPDPAAAASGPPVALQRTEFGMDLGGAATVDGLRQLWQRLLKTERSLAGLRPIIVVRDRGRAAGTQLRLVAGPLRDAASAARLCAAIVASDCACEAAVFDGQSLTVAGPAAQPRRTARRNPVAAGPKESGAAPEPSARRSGRAAGLNAP